MLERFFPGAAHLQNMHPLVVHLPIGFLYGATLLYFIASLARRESVAWAAMWLLVLGVLAALAAVGTGLWAKSGVMLAVSVKHNVMRPHMRLMIATTAIAAVLTLWALVARPMPASGRSTFLLGLLVMCVVMAKGADYGGMMVYDYNGGGGACSQPIEYTPGGSPAM